MMRKVNFWTIPGMWKRMRSYPFIFLPSYHHHHHLSPINVVFKDLIKYHIISQWNVRKRFFSVFSVYVALFLLILPRRPGGHGHLYTCISDALPGYHGQCSFSSLAYPRKLWRWFFFQLSRVLFRYVYYFSSVLFHQLFLTYMTTLPNPFANRSSSD